MKYRPQNLYQFLSQSSLNVYFTNYGHYLGKNFEVLATRTVGRQSPKILRVCIDVRIY
jgi:hypothetical protein